MGIPILLSVMMTIDFPQKMQSILMWTTARGVRKKEAVVKGEIKGEIKRRD